MDKFENVSAETVLAVIEAWFSRPHGAELLTAVRIAIDLFGDTGQESADIDRVSFEVAGENRRLARRGLITATPSGDIALGLTGRWRDQVSDRQKK